MTALRDDEDGWQGSAPRWQAEPSRRITGRTRAERTVDMCDCLIDITAALFCVSGREMRQPGRSSHAVARVRQIAMYVAHVALRLNMREVGHGFGRDRTTVLYACHLVEDMRDDNEFDCIVALAERVAVAVINGREDA